MPTTQDIEAGNAPSGVGTPMVDFGQNAPADTSQQYGPPDPGTAPQPWQVEDRNLWIQGLQQHMQRQAEMAQQALLPDISQMQAQASQYPDLSQLQQVAEQRPDLIQQSAAQGGWQTPATPNALAGPQMGPPIAGQQLSEPIPSTYQNPFGTDRYENDPILGAMDKLAAIPGQVSQAVTGPVINPLTDPLINLLPGRAQVGALAARTAAEQAPGYVAASLIPGGQGAITASMMKQAADAAAAYNNGDLSGKQAISQLAMSIGPMALPMVLHAIGPAAKALSDLVASDSGQQILARARTLPSAEAGGGTFGEKPPVGPEGGGSSFDEYMKALEARGSGQLQEVPPPAPKSPSALQSMTTEQLTAALNDAEQKASTADQHFETVRKYAGPGEPEYQAALNLRNLMFGEHDRVAAELRQRLGSPVGPEARGLPASDQLPAPPEAQQNIPTQTEWMKLVQALKDAGATDAEIGRMTGYTSEGQAATGITRQVKPAVDLAIERQQVDRSPADMKTSVLQEGGSPTDAAALELATHAADTLVNDVGRENLNDPNLLQQFGAKTRFAAGDTPVQGVNRIAMIADGLRKTLLRPSMNPGIELEGAAYRDLNRALDKLTYVGDRPNFDSLPRQTKLAMAYSEPANFTGMDPKLSARLDQIDKATRWETFHALDPTIAPKVAAGQRYLPQRWLERPTSTLEVPLQRGPSGEVSVAKARTFNTISDGLAAGQRLDPQYSLKDLWGIGRNETAKGIADAFTNSEILKHYGTNDPADAAKRGFVPVTNPKMKALSAARGGSWFLPSAVNNATEHVFQPEGGASSFIGKTAGLMKSTAIIPFDAIGATKRMQGMTPGNWMNMAYAMLNDMTGHRLFDPSFGTELPPDALATMFGAPQGSVGSATAGKGVSGIMRKVQSPVTDVLWGKALGYLRLKADEGANATFNVGSKNPLTESGVRRRLAESHMAASTSGGGMTALRQGRAATESRFMFSSPTTRGLIQNAGLVANLLKPTANAAERIAAAKNIMQTGLAVWGLGSLINMKFGNGKPVPLPIEWKDGQFKYNSDWGTIPALGEHVPLFANRSFITLLAKSGTILANEGVNAPSDLIPAVKSGDMSGLGSKIGELAAPSAGFLLGRESPAATAISAAAGYGYDPETGLLHMGNLTPQQRLQAAAPVPINLKQVMEGKSPLEMGLGAWPIKGPPNPAFEQPKADLASVMTEWEQAHPNYSGKQWGDAFKINNAAYHALEYQAAQKAGLNAQNPDPTLAGYYQILHDNTNALGQPKDAAALSDALDQYTAEHPDLQVKLDAITGQNPRPMSPGMQEHYANIKVLENGGYFKSRSADWSNFAHMHGHSEWQTPDDLRAYIAQRANTDDPNAISATPAWQGWLRYESGINKHDLATNEDMDIAAYRLGYESVLYGRHAAAYEAKYGERPAIRKGT